MTRIPADREFPVLERGYVRDNVVLANWRSGLRQQIDPETGAPFTEDEIRRATQQGTRWHIEAQALDDFGQSEQRRALFLVDQIPVERASTKWLENFHARLWGKAKLSATGGSGYVTVQATPGTIISGSTTPGAPSAYVATDPRKNRYQVLTTVTVPVSGTATVALFALSTGAETNPQAGTVLKWEQTPPGAQPTCTVSTSFSGGTNPETDAEQANRIQQAIRHKEGAGNDAQMRAWARAASNAVEDAFVYPCALHAGTTIVAITQKRGATVGPLGRLPSVGTLTSVRAYMTPPGSPVVPTPPWVLVVPVVSQPTGIDLALALPKGTDSGWADAAPFPTATAGQQPVITTVNSQTDFVFSAVDSTLPNQSEGATLTGANAPRLMVWDTDLGEFETLNVASVEDTGSAFRVLLNAAPSKTLAVNDRVSPATLRSGAIAAAVRAYFDSLGPADLFDPTADPRGHRCVRFPLAAEQWPSRGGPAIGTRVSIALGSLGADLLASDTLVPAYPADLTTGPRMLTLDQLGVYPL